MTLGLVQGTQVQMASSCIFQKTTSLVIFSLVKQDQESFLVHKVAKIQIYWSKVTHPQPQTLGDMNAEWFGFMQEK